MQLASLYQLPAGYSGFLLLLRGDIILRIASDALLFTLGACVAYFSAFYEFLASYFGWLHEI